MFRTSFAWGYISNSREIVRAACLNKDDWNTNQTNSYNLISLVYFLLDEYRCRKRFSLSALHLMGKFTELGLHDFVAKITKSLENNEIGIGAFFDIKGTFNNTQTRSPTKAQARYTRTPYTSVPSSVVGPSRQPGSDSGSNCD
ncbi:hypothetical protein Trydic_g12690 [Trypoxylus dichotomus]